MTDTERALKLLNDMHRDRLSYDEYELLIGCIQELQQEKEQLETRLMTIREAIYGKN